MSSDDSLQYRDAQSLNPSGGWSIERFIGIGPPPGFAAMNAEIAEFLATHPSEEWAARYSADDENSTFNLQVSPDFGYTAEHHSCSGAIYDFGTASLVGPSLILQPGPLSTSPWGTREYFMVRWGGRRYLVDSSRVDDFANSINLGAEPRSDPKSGGPLLRSGDELKPVPGLLTGQTWLDQYLLLRPLRGRFRNMKRNPSEGYEPARATAIIPFGDRDGVFPNMQLPILADGEVTTRPKGFAFVEVVGPRFSTVMLNCAVSEEPAPADRFTTTLSDTRQTP